MDEQEKNATITPAATNEEGNLMSEGNLTSEGNVLTGPQSRRDFLLKGMTLAAALPLVLAVDSFSQTARAKAPKIHWVDLKSTTAKQFKYTMHADKKPKSFWTEFDKTKNVPGDRPLLCWECLYFSATGDATKATHAPCQIFSGQYVHYDDVCTMWTQNPRYKGKKHKA